MNSPIPVSCHEQLAAAIPVSHNTDPAGNVFIAAFTGGPHPLIIGTMRYRMPDPPDPDKTIRIAAHMLTRMQAHPWTLTRIAVAAAYGPRHLAGPLIEVVHVALAASVTVADLLRVEAGRCWSWLCPYDDCGCDPAGPGLLVDELDDAVIQLATELTQRGA